MSIQLPYKYLAGTLLLLSGMITPVQAQAQYEVPSSPEGIRPVLVGMNIPDFDVTTIDGDAFELLKAIQSKPTVLVYYRGSWCPYCNLQLAALQQIEPVLKEMGYQIIAIAADRPSNLLSSIDRSALTDTLLSDSTMAGAVTLGIAWRDPRGGSKLEQASGMDHHLIPVPAVFVLNQRAEIQFQYVNPNHRVRLDGDVLVAAARAALGSSS